MVFRRAEYCRPRPVDMVLAAVDELLRMLDPAAHLEGFEVGGDSRPAQAEGTSGTSEADAFKDFPPLDDFPSAVGSSGKDLPF